MHVFTVIIYFEISHIRHGMYQLQEILKCLNAYVL